MQESTRRNRHGIPVYDFTDPRPGCIWPSCGAVITTYPSLHLCDRHVEKVHRVASEERAHQHNQELDWQTKRAAEWRSTMWSTYSSPPPRPEPKHAPEPVVYYLKTDGHIKIGWTGNLEQRMRQYSPGVELLAVHPGSRADERRLHKRFAVHRSHGREWYPLVPVILEHIRRVISEHGAPPTVSFGAKPVEVPQVRERQAVTPKYWTGTRRAG